MAGNFTTIGNIASQGQSPIAATIAMMNTSSEQFTALATEANGNINQLAIQPGTGVIYAAGGLSLLQPTFTGASGVSYYDTNEDAWTFPGAPTHPEQFIYATASNPVNSITFDENGNPILGGSTSLMATVTPLKGLAIFTNNAWSVIGNGVCGGSVKAVQHWNGILYVGGDFTKVNDVNNNCGSAAMSANGFAAFDLSTSTWSILNTNLPAGSFVNSLWLSNFEADNATTGLSDFILMAGSFPSVNGSTSMQNLAKWDGSSWSPATSLPLPFAYSNDTWLNIAVSDGARVYIGGLFSNDNITNVGYFDSETSTWNNMGGGLICQSPSCYEAYVTTISYVYQLQFAPGQALGWSGLFTSLFVSWKYWLIFLCIILAGAIILAIVTNLFWSVVGCCRIHCFHSRPKEVGL